VLSGLGLGQIIRLASHIVLARLLFPEAFGLMALVGVYMYALAMCTDTGVWTVAVRSKRGEDRDFLNTAWTVQLGRGILLCALSMLIAAPVALLCGHPELGWLLPLAGLTALITGFTSTGAITLQRRMDVGRLTMLDLSGQVVGTATTLTLAWIYGSVWTLIVGGLAGTAFKTIAGYLVLPGASHRLRWEAEAVREFVRLGKWVFLSSLTHFLSSQADRALLGLFLPLAVLGAYSLAGTMADVALMVSIQLAHGVAYPMLVRLHHDFPGRLAGSLHRTRFWLEALFLPALGAGAAVGPLVAGLLYDRRYAEVGPILQLLCLRAAIACVHTTCETALTVLGHTQYGFFAGLARGAWVWTGIPLAWYFGGPGWVLWVLALSEVGPLIVVMSGIGRVGLWGGWSELRAPACFLLGWVAGTLFARLW
jgi:O-antigen/teichoic acid export membrane protein